MKRIALVGIVWWITVLVPTSSAGCARLPLRAGAKDAARGQAALATIREDASEAGRAVADARHATLLAADTVAGAARAAATIPPGRALGGAP